MKKYVSVWLLVSIFLVLEYYFLKNQPKFSFLLFLQAKKIISAGLEINTQPGRILSLWLGWMGLGFMIIMNLYSMRKRLSFMQSLGKLPAWLDFHIFCGLVGPTLILFHCDFKVRGLVSISFWSMMVSFSSGIIGRYFYVQMLRAKVDLENEAQKKLKQLDMLFEKLKLNISASDKTFVANQAIQFVGAPVDASDVGVVSVFFNSFIGDLRIAFSQINLPAGWPGVASFILTDYGLAKRRALFLESFKKLMGYWHAFHFPFAIFMYVVAVIHVAAALILGVK